ASRGGGGTSSRATPVSAPDGAGDAATYVRATAREAMPLAPARPATTGGSLGTTATAPPDGGVGGVGGVGSAGVVVDAPSASGANSAAAVPPTHRQNTSGTGPHPSTTGDNHASPTRPARTDRPKIAPPTFDRGD